MCQGGGMDPVDNLYQKVPPIGAQRLSSADERRRREVRLERLVGPLTLLMPRIARC